MQHLASSMVVCALVSFGCGGSVSVSGEGGGGGTAATGGPTTSGSAPGTSGNGSSGSGNGSCTLVGTWDGISGIDGSNPSSSASFTFSANGTWIGGVYAQNPVATEFMHGNYSVAGGILTLDGEGMGPQCAKSAQATYGITYAPDCAHVNLLTQTDNCTGARLWLSASGDGTDMIRRL